MQSQEHTKHCLRSVQAALPSDRHILTSSQPTEHRALPPPYADSTGLSDKIDTPEQTIDGANSLHRAVNEKNP